VGARLNLVETRPSDEISVCKPPDVMLLRRDLPVVLLW
jgi:hypothetical protein